MMIKLMKALMMSVSSWVLKEKTITWMLTLTWMSNLLETTTLMSTNNWSTPLCAMSMLISAMISFLTNQKLLNTLMQTTSFFCMLFFSSNSTLLSFTMFEMSSLPMVYAILIFGHQMEMLNATQMMMTYSLISGLPLLLFVSQSHNTNNFWLEQSMSPESTLLFITPFLIKTPTYILHLWLPLAHVEAPTSGSVVLASLMLKLGTLGLLKASLMLPNTMMHLTILGMVICPMLSMMQTDMKATVAYSSVGHMSTLCLGLWLQSITTLWSSSMLQVSHGMSSGLLFLLVGSSTHTLSTRTLYYGATNSTTLLFISTTFNSGGPISLPFLVETYFLSGVSNLGTLCMVIITLNILFTSYYNFYLMTSSLKNTSHSMTPTTLILISLMNLLTVLM